MRIYIVVISILVSIDQIIKIIVRNTLTSSSYIELIPNFVHLTYQENKGISFSLLADIPSAIRVPILTGVSALVIIGLCIFIFKNRHNLTKGEMWGFSLILSGAIGNLIDRAVRKQVTDYMFFHFFEKSFFVNNLADDLISFGFVLIVWQSFRKKESKDEK
ncbi:signal peptidase II [bacterium]|nr:signal peptidase II [bacterium]